ncbi:MAG TPA: hypothetical protein VK116_16640, partial [Planctomycetota bacterium]|nr:hypothetical protein [Planctomycetota bacterium]
GAEIRSREKIVGAIKHSITFRRILVDLCTLEADALPADLGPRYRWARLDELGESVPVPSLCAKIARRLEDKKEHRSC